MSTIRDSKVTISTETLCVRKTSCISGQQVITSTVFGGQLNTLL